eukprot:TRINITY_DN734_c0_g1_i2.p2 TRINITY_DN734_c0_g1~~TRINITY_DN734_c0_g1_i2.p2  ORF type:complete len:134 (+),score=28.48 TRINITY_DN734_c0_g1_i2:449-850(+)
MLKGTQKIKNEQSNGIQITDILLPKKREPDDITLKDERPKKKKKRGHSSLSFTEKTLLMQFVSRCTSETSIVIPWSLHREELPEELQKYSNQDLAKSFSNLKKKFAYHNPDNTDLHGKKPKYIADYFIEHGIP